MGHTPPPRLTDLRCVCCGVATGWHDTGVGARHGGRATGRATTVGGNVLTVTSYRETQASEKRDDEVRHSRSLRSRICVISRTRFDTTYGSLRLPLERKAESGPRTGDTTERYLSVSAERCPYSVQTLIHSDSKSAQCVSLSSRSVRLSNAVITRWLWLGMGFRLSTRLRKDPQNQLGRPRHPHPLRRARWEQPRTLARSPGHRSGWAWRRAGRADAA